MKKSEEFILSSAKKMFAFGASFAKKLKEKERILLLEGPLGAGKTTFAQGFAHGLGITDSLTSPTFTLLNSYAIPGQKRQLHHLDLYRIKTAEELIPLGIFELLHGSNDIVLIEWSNKHPEIFTNQSRTTLSLALHRTGRSVQVTRTFMK